MYKKIYTQYKYILWSVLRVYWFLKKLSSKKQATKTTVDSYDIYQNYNDRE